MGSFVIPGRREEAGPAECIPDAVNVEAVPELVS